MLDTTNHAIASLVAHAHINPEAQREFQLAVSRVVANHETNLTLPQKQLGLICVLDELVRTMPGEYQGTNTLAVIATMLLGSRLLTAISTAVSLPHSEDA
jgi:hypothetical protein